MAAYATASDLINQYDETTLNDLCVDDGVPETSLDTNSKVTWALDRATGEINAAVLVGQLYTVETLLALSGESEVYLKSLCCELAMAYLILRRPEKYGSEATKEFRQSIKDTLDMFRRGERVFDVAANKEAGLPTIDGPRAVDYQRLNLLPNRTQNFYPHTATRLPLGRGN